MYKQSNGISSLPKRFDGEDDSYVFPDLIDQSQGEVIDDNLIDPVLDPAYVADPVGTRAKLDQLKNSAPDIWDQIKGLPSKVLDGYLKKKTNADGSLDLLSIGKDLLSGGAALAAYNSASQPVKPTGYTGGIPKLTAVRGRADDPTAGYRAGQGGHQYFTGNRFANLAADQSGSEGLAAIRAQIEQERLRLNEQNAARARAYAAANPAYKSTDINSDKFFGRTDADNLATSTIGQRTNAGTLLSNVDKTVTDTVKGGTGTDTVAGGNKTDKIAAGKFDPKNPDHMAAVAQFGKALQDMVASGNESGAKNFYNEKQKALGFTDAELAPYLLGGKFNATQIDQWKTNPAVSPTGIAAVKPATQQSVIDQFGQGLQSLISSGNEAGAKNLYNQKQKELGFTDAQMASSLLGGKFNADQIGQWKSTPAATGDKFNAANPAQAGIISQFGQGIQSLISSGNEAGAKNLYNQKQKEYGFTDAEMASSLLGGKFNADQINSWKSTPAATGDKFNAANPAQAGIISQFGQGIQSLISSGNEAGAKALYNQKQKEYGFTDAEMAPLLLNGQFKPDQISAWKTAPVATAPTGIPPAPTAPAPTVASPALSTATNVNGIAGITPAVTGAIPSMTREAAPAPTVPVSNIGLAQVKTNMFDPTNTGNLQAATQLGQGLRDLIAGGNEAGARDLLNQKQQQFGLSNEDVSKYVLGGSFDPNQVAAWKAGPANSDVGLVNTKPVAGQTTQSMAGGGMTSHNGKYLQGATDGMADKIPGTIDGIQPARLAHGEFVIPADVVSHLGNGNSDAGAQQLYKMMDKIRMARTGNKKQGKRINPNKFMPGGLADLQSYAAGGTIHFAAGDTVPAGVSGVEQNLSSWAGPYVTNMLGQGQALAEEEMYNPQFYQGELTAGDSALQQQAYYNAANLSTPTSIGTAANTAGTAAKLMGGLSYQPGDIAPFMSPYTQGVTDVANKEAQRNADIAATQRRAGAVSVGAFGGSRQAIQDAEADRNLAMIKNANTTKGLQDAFTAAQNASQFGATYGLNALQGATNAASTQGQLGGLQNQTGLANLSTQLTAGNQQQATKQAGLTADQAMFNEQKTEPFKMVQYQQSLLQGLPITAQSYSMINNPITAAAGAAGTVNKLFSGSNNG